MDSSNLNAMLTTASELAMESRWREAVEICRRVVAADPRQFEAWWTLAQGYDKLNLKSEARKAYSEYYSRAPKRSDLRWARKFAADEIGVTFEEAVDDGEEGSYPLVMFSTTINGEQTLVQARNDSGKPLKEVIAAAEKLVNSSNPFDAWVHAQRHPELYTAIADTVLSALAQAQSNAGARAGTERYRDALRRGRVEGVVPFAEIALLEPSEFLAFVTSYADTRNLFRTAALLHSFEF
jgi:predicted Zn-dependent protease